MTSRRRTLGTQLAWLVTLSTGLGLAVFTGVAAFVVWLDERGERDAFEEVVEDVGLAVVTATPVGLLVALLGARWAARRVTARIDALVASASRMTADDLDERLPISGRGDELDALSAALNDLFARLDHGIADLRRFAADASHELRTPLTVMINSLEVARRRPREPAEWERISGEALDELRRMADLVEALLQSARSGAFDLAADPVDIDSALELIADRWRSTAADAGVDLAVSAGTGAGVRVDARGLGIAVGNLIGNAIKHSPRGGTVAIRGSRRNGRVAIDVDDQGPGVPPAERRQIFTPFARSGGPQRSASGNSGTSLGLSITRRIVEAHGGTVQVDDAPGGGARFTIDLPVA